MVVDPFAGSGTTGIAALSLGRNCVLIDNQQKYYQIALQRLEDELNVRTAERMEGSDKGDYNLKSKPYQWRLLDGNLREVEKSQA